MPEIANLGEVMAIAIAPYLTDNVLRYSAGEDLSALRVVRAFAPGIVVYARPPEVEALAPLGITTHSAVNGEPVTVAVRGEVQDASWSWVAGQPVLLGLDGALTQTQPLGIDTLVVIATAIAVDTIVIRIDPPIALAT
jgi:hypothetical protein